MPDDPSTALGTEERPLRVAVVGSGPSGFYAVAALYKQSDLHVAVDVFDRLPTPFGLVRGGVAPDHQKIKNVVRVYDKTAAREGFRFFGHVDVGHDVTVDELDELYDQVVFAVGNESDRRLGLAGEDLEGVYSATEFVGWYNGHPAFQDRQFDLSQARRVAVIGNGNVAIDVTRVLVRDPEELATTDITDRALDTLRASSVEEVVLLGRRGPAQAAFTTKEIKEVAALDGVDLVVGSEEMELDDATEAWIEDGVEPAAIRNLDFLREVAGAEADPATRRVCCRFLVSPTGFVGDENGRLRGVEIERNELYRSEDGTPRPRGTGATEELEVQLVFKAVGYRGLPLPGLPFDERRGVLPNRDGRLIDPKSDRVLPGRYVVGWAKRGPTGLIGTNGPDSEATVARMIEDLERGDVPRAERPEPEAIERLLAEKGVDWVSFEDWKRLEKDEVERGAALGKVRQKYTDVESMMTAVHRLRDTSEGA